jgi:phosphonate transport system ATP-binding protein
MTPALIEARDLTLRFPTGRVALQRVSFSASPGELVVILGANGSGKSTILRCIAGILLPTAGHVSVNNCEIGRLSGRSLREARTALGIISQRANLVRRRSVLANVTAGTLGRHRTITTALGCLPRGERDFALECLDAVGLKQLANQRAATLSGGQAQRVSVARLCG